MNGTAIRNLLFLLFAISGFSGLIYESIWAHYLKLFLGHAAYAQSLVLAIFMAGMATGSWIVSRYGISWKNLLLAYAVVEATIGIAGVLFHTMFVQATGVTYYNILPNVNAIAFAQLIKWSIAASLVLPQSVLLGMTFPLMSAGLIRWFPRCPGASLAMLYFTNSIGGAIGVLISGFVLIERVGLPGAILTAGLLNVALALIVWLLARGRESAAERVPTASQELARTVGSYRLLLIVALLTGTASFIYEIGWIRMLSLVLGSSTHAFELMLSAFIFGLAFGGLWIRKRIDRLADSVSFLGIVQIIMGVLAMSTLLVYARTFELMQWLLAVVTRTDGGYTVFNIVSHGIALTVMLPATFCAGMTLPLITYTLLKQGCGEQSIGKVYAANTLGAIIGVLVAVHLAMPLLGLKGLIVSGAAIDIALGVALLWWVPGLSRPRPAVMAAIIGVGAVVLTVTLVELDAYKMASGVYRYGEFLSPGSAEIRYHKDGKTATVDLVAHPRTGSLAVRTNGKTDAEITVAQDMPVGGDEPTMVMLGLLPLALQPNAKTAAVIGIGAGVTTQTLLDAPWLSRVDTIEIEPAMVQAARGFRPRVDATFTDVRSHIHIDDAKTYLATRNNKYDIIVSEPSNPWVSGVASLFSQEFYGLARRHLQPGGVFVQWIQLYEIDLRLVASVMKALAPEFSDYVVYAPLGWDLVVVAKNGGDLTDADSRIFQAPALSRSLKRIGIETAYDLRLRRLGSKQLLDPLFRLFRVPANSDYFPVLDLGAVRTRFLGSSATALVALQRSPLPVLEMLDGSPAGYSTTQLNANGTIPVAQSIASATALHEFFTNGTALDSYKHAPKAVGKDAQLVQALLQGCKHRIDWNIWFASLHDVVVNMLPYLPAPELERFWPALDTERCGSQMTPAQRAWLELFKAVGARNAAAMAQRADEVLTLEKRLTPTQLDYALGAGMLGSIASGNSGHALALWKRYAIRPHTREQRVLFRLLIAHATTAA